MHGTMQNEKMSRGRLIRREPYFKEAQYFDHVWVIISGAQTVRRPGIEALNWYCQHGWVHCML